MSRTTLKTITIVAVMSATLLGHAMAADAQLGSVLKRAMPTPRPSAAPPSPPDSQPPQAEGRAVRVKVSLRVTGTYQHSGSKAFPAGAVVLPLERIVDNTYRTEYVVAAESTPPFAGLQKVNPLDPVSQQEMDAYEAKVKARDDRIYHSADALRRRGPGAPSNARGPAHPMAMMDPETVQRIMACGGDQACKQRLATELMAAQHARVAAPGGAVTADLQVISDACVATGHAVGSTGHEHCMNEEGERRSTVKRRAADDEPEIAALPDRYLVYRGACQQTRAHVSVNERGLVGVIDTGGYFEGAGTTVGEGDIAPTDMEDCPGQVVFDTSAKVFWGGVLVSVNLDGMVHRTGSADATSGGAIPAEITEWVASALRGAAASGAKTQRFGYRTATVTWSYVRE